MSAPDLEEALRRSEEFAARLVESSRDCIKILDLKGHLLSMNAHGMTALEICDVGPLVGSPWVEFWEGQDRANAKAAIEQAREGKLGRFIGYFPTTHTQTPKW
ncbi:MAG: PAS domain-containing protein, partial [Nitrospira sp.]|nr:PAS domain-containing protein [Nitrospira sp.]